MTTKAKYYADIYMTDYAGGMIDLKRFVRRALWMYMEHDPKHVDEIRRLLHAELGEE